MPGHIISGLTDPATAEEVLVTVASTTTRARAEADAAGLPLGAQVATHIRHLVDHGGEALWVAPLSTTAGSAQPGAAAMERILARAFPDTVRTGAGVNGT